MKTQNPVMTGFCVFCTAFVCSPIFLNHNADEGILVISSDHKNMYKASK